MPREIPSSRYIDIGPSLPKANVSAVAAQGQALAGVGEVLQNMGERGLQLLEQARKSKENGAIDALFTQFDSDSSAFENQLMRRNDTKQWVPDWKEKDASYREKINALGLSPEGKGIALAEYAKWYGRKSIAFETQAATKDLQIGRAQTESSLQYFGKRGEMETYHAIAKRALDQGFMNQAQYEQTMRNGARLASLNELDEEMKANPNAFLERLKDKDFVRNTPGITMEDKDDFEHKAKVASRERIGATIDAVQDEIADGSIQSPQDLEKKYKDALPPRILEQLKGGLGERRMLDPKVLNEIAGEASASIARYNVGSDASFEEFVRIDNLIHSLPPGLPLRDTLTRQLRETRDGQRGIIKDNIALGNKELDEAFAAGRFGTYQREQTLLQVLDDGFLSDPRKLHRIGFSPRAVNAIVNAKGVEAQRKMFRALFDVSRDHQADANSYEWKVAEALRDDTGLGTAMAKWEDSDARAVAYQRYGQARADFAQWAALTPGADMTMIRTKLKDLTTDADKMRAQSSTLPEKPRSPIETSMNAQSGKTLGQFTSYGYEGDTTPDRNSSAGIGAFVSKEEQARIRAGEDTPNKLRTGDLAISRDIEERFVAAGLEPGDTVTIKFADGTTKRTRWMDRTAASYNGKALTGRFDFYSPTGPSRDNGKEVVGFSI